MNLSRSEISHRFNSWLDAWNRYNLEGVMDFMHEDVIFENWDGVIVFGKSALQKAWLPWFIHHGNFTFTKENIFIDEEKQQMAFQWQLEWLSFEKKYKNQPEKRRGMDVLHLKDGKIYKKDTYSKTVIEINSSAIKMQAI